MRSLLAALLSSQTAPDATALPPLRFGVIFHDSLYPNSAHSSEAIGLNVLNIGGLFCLTVGVKVIVVPAVWATVERRLLILVDLAMRGEI